MLELRGISKHLGAHSLSDVSLALHPGEYFALLGPSGVGKTVLVEIIAGLIRPDAGRITWAGEDLTGTPPECRGFSVVYQDYALFPHMTVEQNVRYGLAARGRRLESAAGRVADLADSFGIGYLLERRPASLSGGERQRVAVARALASRPRMVLLDEPLRSLDPNARSSLRRELKRIHRETGAVFFHVTHDTEEALQLADRVGVMLDGTICQVETPLNLFRRPSDRRVAGFLGMRNILPAAPLGPGLCRAGGREVFAAGAHDAISFIWVRPEEVLLSRQPFDSSARNQFPCAVTGWEHQGPLLAVSVRAGEMALTALITHESFSTLQLTVGAQLYCTFKSSAVHCF